MGSHAPAAWSGTALSTKAQPSPALSFGLVSFTLTFRTWRDALASQVKLRPSRVSQKRVCDSSLLRDSELGGLPPPFAFSSHLEIGRG